MSLGISDKCSILKSEIGKENVMRTFQTLSSAIYKRLAEWTNGLERFLPVANEALKIQGQGVFLFYLFNFMQVFWN